MIIYYGDNLILIIECNILIQEFNINCYKNNPNIIILIIFIMVEFMLDHYYNTIVLSTKYI